MAWVKLSDDWYDDPKIVAAGDSAALLWVKAVSWSARNLTDGLIPAELLPRLISSPETPTIASRLVDLGLFVEDITGGFRVANYLDYQPSRESVLAKREADAERKRQSRGRPSAVRPDSGAGPNHPDPGPVPEGSLSSSSVLPVDTVLHGIELREVYEAIGDLRVAARSDIRSPSTWRQRVVENLPGQVQDDVVRAIETFDEPARTIAEVVEGKRHKQYLKRRTNGATA